MKTSKSKLGEKVDINSKGLMVLSAIAVIAIALFISYNQRRLVSYQQYLSNLQKSLQIQKSQEQQLMQVKTLNLSAENKSGESGTATLKEVNGKVVVSLSLTGFPKNVAQPTHIHVGSCPGVGAVKYPLTSVTNGVSETTLNVTMAQLTRELPLAVNVHKSSTQSGVYVSCGQL
ncbi:hypothetical protein A2627_04765 [Candidatus Woesebacteria bacterium RIFCSPHIGHO2_01_FULL_39_28]|uniref:CHRD domain-containing protein n=1 Tax=Candidatus Woesebacteria bacterium RIFCSPHIGHO2_01_FULL_39_28 TaxID=1802496 RepID=A0A1F7YCC5_9BACT|nr:MAG: hypothetical protein A2627_04765 [Candidatus Woesebacteria bacterium RIFCSPHIGHO2_01_FULL_39_28]OGM58443.1 MAG: hypothetical protein A3A50_01040 [Candidatus Woesebacteria bacterium RIFCSPLOWO2_01_FULL_38_20]